MYTLLTLKENIAAAFENGQAAQTLTKVQEAQYNRFNRLATRLAKNGTNRVYNALLSTEDKVELETVMGQDVTIIAQFDEAGTVQMINESAIRTNAPAAYDTEGVKLPPPMTTNEALAQYPHIFGQARMTV